MSSTELTFDGFDGNNEWEYCNVCDILIDDMKRFKTLKKVSDFNSHVHRVDKYKKMLNVFEPLRSQIPDKKLSLMEIQSVLNAY